VRGAGCREINLRIRRREKNVLDIPFYRASKILISAVRIIGLRNLERHFACMSLGSIETTTNHAGDALVRPAEPQLDSSFMDYQHHIFAFSYNHRKGYKLLPDQYFR
jgi:hypothetical protein